MHNLSESETGAPPSPNRGVLPYNFTFSVDWLAFTCYERGDFEWLDSHLEYAGVGRRGYAESASLPGGGFLAWTDERRDIHCSLPASALAYLSEWYTAGDLLRLACVGKATRLDMAFDDKRADGLQFADIVACVEQGRYVSRWRDINELRNIQSADGVLGRTVYFGSRKSEAFLRVYDKRAEMINKRGDDPGPWMRAELELKRKRADAVLRKLVDMPECEHGRWGAALLNGYIEFKEFTSDSNLQRVPTASWWRSFLGDCDKVHLSIPKKKRDIETVVSWLMLQASPSLALLAQVDPGHIDSLVRSGVARMSKEHQGILRSHKEKMESNPAYRSHWLAVVSELVEAGMV